MENRWGVARGWGRGGGRAGEWLQRVRSSRWWNNSVCWLQWWGHRSPGVREWHQIIHMQCTDVNCLVLTLYYNYVSSHRVKGTRDFSRTDGPWTTWGLEHQPLCSWKPVRNFWFPQNLTTVVPQCPWIGSRTPSNAQILRSSSPFHKEQRVMHIVGPLIRRFLAMDGKYSFLPAIA